MTNANGPLEEHARAVRERWNDYVRGNFDPWNLPPHMPRADDRMLAAMEYAAFQLGEINQRLAYLMSLTEQLRDDQR